MSEIRSPQPVQGATAHAPTAEPPIGQAWHAAPFFASWKRFWRSYVVFSGRATRSDLWWSVLGNVICMAVLGAIWGIIAAVSSSGDQQNPVAAVLGMIPYSVFSA